MSYDYMLLDGGGKFWGTQINETGFMGFVDKWWLFWSRVNTILFFIFFIPMIIISIISLASGGGKESFITDKLRQLKNKYQ